MDRRVEVIKKKKISNTEQKKDKVKNQFEEKVQDPKEDLRQSSESLDENTLLQIQIEDLNDKLLRAQAEIQNVRRVAGQEVTKARLFGVESLAREFISVGDKGTLFISDNGRKWEPVVSNAKWDIHEVNFFSN